MQPEIFKRIMRFKGKTRREVSNPCITANEAIELANYIGGSMERKYLNLAEYVTPQAVFQARMKQQAPEEVAKAVQAVFEAEEKTAERAFILFQQEQIKDLVGTLQALYDLQNGSPLPSYDKDYEKAMNESSRVLGYWHKFYSGE